MINFDKIMPMKKCPVCKKEFIPAGQHAYKMPRSERLVCSYHCMRQAQREYDSKLKYKKTRERRDT